jgi:hypothetical protein
LWVLCVVRLSLRRAGPSSRGVLPSVVCLKCVIVKPRKMRRPRPPRGCRAIEKKIVKASEDLGLLQRSSWFSSDPSSNFPKSDTTGPLPTDPFISGKSSNDMAKPIVYMNTLTLSYLDSIINCHAIVLRPENPVQKDREGLCVPNNTFLLFYPPNET